MIKGEGGKRSEGDVYIGSYKNRLPIDNRNWMRRNLVAPEPSPLPRVTTTPKMEQTSRPGMKKRIQSPRRPRPNVRLGTPRVWLWRPRHTQQRQQAALTREACRSHRPLFTPSTASHQRTPNPTAHTGCVLYSAQKARDRLTNH